MSEAKARIIARCIYRGTMTIDKVAVDNRPLVREQYALLFGEELA